MNIELEEVVLLDVSDEALEQAAGGAQGGKLHYSNFFGCGIYIHLQGVSHF